MIFTKLRKNGRGFAIQRGGFSLVEVTLALGIMSTGVLLLFALIPTSLETMRSQAVKAMERGIAEGMIGELMNNEWDKLHDFHEEFRYFDSQGVELESDGDGATEDITVGAVFTARLLVKSRDVRLDHDGDLNLIYGTTWSPPYKLGDESVPPGVNVDLNLRKVVVQITDVPGENAGVFNFDDTANSGRFREYAGLVSNMMDADALSGGAGN